MAAILKIVFGYISPIYCPINAKFGTKKQNHTDTDHATKIPNFKNSRHGRRPTFWIWFYRYISASDQPNSTKFDMQMQMLIQRMVTW